MARRERTGIEFPDATWTTSDRYDRYGAIARCLRASLGEGRHRVLDVGDAAGYLRIFAGDLRLVGVDVYVQPERLEEVLASVLDRRQERAERRREHIAELNKRAAETDLRLKRLYDAIEAGVADLDDPALRERVVSLKAIRDQAQADAARAAAMLESSGQQAITPQMVQKFARTARERIRIDGGGYRRDHLRALSQHVAGDVEHLRHDRRGAFFLGERKRDLPAGERHLARNVLGEPARFGRAVAVLQHRDRGT